MAADGMRQSSLIRAPVGTDTIRMRPVSAGYRRLGTDTDEETPMTDTNEAVITEALSVIDAALATMMSRELVTSGEVTDVLLDVRSLLTLPAPVPAETH